MSIKSLRGDTIIEVLLATTIFALISISTMIIMNGNTNNLEANLELTMVRAEVDAQAEAIRFIHDAYVAEGDYTVTTDYHTSDSQYYQFWKRLTEELSSDSAPAAALDSCNDYYDNNGANYIFANSSSRKAYVINTRNLEAIQKNYDGTFAGVIIDDDAMFVPAVTHSKVVFGMSKNSNSDNSALISDNSANVYSVQGIWVHTVPAQVQSTDTTGKPEFYDFHVYACWYGPGRNHPSTIGTILRLYNPAIGGK